MISLNRPLRSNQHWEFSFCNIWICIPFQKQNQSFADGKPKMLHSEARAEEEAEHSSDEREVGQFPEPGEPLGWEAGAAGTSTVWVCTCAVIQREKRFLLMGHAPLLLSAVGGMETCLASQQTCRSFPVGASQLTLSQYFSICFIQVKMTVLTRSLSPVLPQCHILLGGYTFDNKFLLKCNMLLSGTIFFSWQRVKYVFCPTAVLEPCYLTLLTYFWTLFFQPT